MAHFAQLDQDNIITQVIVVSNDVIIDNTGQESEELGIAFCQSLYGEDTCWVQTSYNGNLRKRYAGIGYTYDTVLDAFVAPQPYPSWLLDAESAAWVAPIPQPQDELGPDQRYIWSEDQQTWQILEFPQTSSTEGELIDTPEVTP